MSKLDGVEIEEKLVGFDARIGDVPAWLQEQREQYLLRPDVERPMSADEMVWPSAVDYPYPSRDQDENGTTERAWTSRNAPLWDDLERLKKPHLNDHGLFGDLQQAAEFKLVSDRRVEEHAPFFVFGIYLLC
jgi:hypothetical protein